MLFLSLSFASLVLSQDPAQIPLSSVLPNTGFALDGIPLLGFGTWNLKAGNTSDAVSWAVQVGYRHIDCAASYGNEEEVGRGIADGLQKTGLSRADLWITSKLWNDHHHPDLVEKAIDTSLGKLGLQYLDLYHMHWPVASTARGNNEISYLDTWAAMTLLLANGKTRHLGVSNFSPAQLEDLLHHTTTPPAVHQMELHPYLQQSTWLAYHRNHSIHVTAYSPLGSTQPPAPASAVSAPGNPAPLLRNPVIARIARRRNCTPAQVILQWGMARGTSVIPKSAQRDHIEENIHSVECVLRGKDRRELEGLARERKRYVNPTGTWGVPLFEGLEDFDGRRGRATWWDE